MFTCQKTKQNKTKQNKTKQNHFLVSFSALGGGRQKTKQNQNQNKRKPASPPKKTKTKTKQNKTKQKKKKNMPVSERNSVSFLASVTNGSTYHSRKRQFLTVEHSMCDDYLFLFRLFMVIHD